MPVMSIIGAAIGASTIGAAGGVLAGVVGNVAAAAIGGAIGGGIGGGVGSVVMGGSFGDGFKSGAIGGAIGAGFNALGGFEGIFGGGTSAAEFAAADAAQLAGQGLSASAIAQNLSYTGLSTAEMAAAMSSAGFSSSDITSALKSGNTYATDSISSSQIPSTLSDLSSPEYFNALGQDITNLGQIYDTGTYNVNQFDPTTGSLEDINVPTPMEGMSYAPEFTSNLNDLSGIYEGSTLEGVGNAPTTGVAAGVNAPITSTGLTDLWSKAKAGISNVIPKSLDSGQMAFAGMQTLQDYMNANKIQDLANQAAIPYNKYMSTFDNPNAYWDEYINGKGGEMMNNAARKFANSGRTGMLPLLYTMGHQDYLSNYLPQVRQGLATGGQMASANMQQQSYPMQMRTRALSHIPNVMTTNKLMDIYRRRG